MAQADVNDGYQDDMGSNNNSQSKAQNCQNNNNNNSGNKNNKGSKDKSQLLESFEDMKLKKELLRGISEYGFKKPSPIQQRCIVQLVQKRDVIAQAQSGTGRTTTILIASLQILDTKQPHCQVLVLVPTDEVALEIHKVCTTLAAHMNVTCRPCINISGTAYREARREFQKGVQIVIGTPAQVGDLLDRGAINLSKLQLFVLDEADKIILRGYRDQIYDCLQYSRHDVQLAFFSATMPHQILELKQKFMRNPVSVLVSSLLSLDDIKQYRVEVGQEKYKLDTLLKLYSTLNIQQAIIYCNTKTKVNWLVDRMKQHNFTVSSMHSEMKQQQINKIRKEFRDGKTRLLITTDLLTRDIEVAQVPPIINYDIPANKDQYIERIGHSKCYERNGFVINFVTDETYNDMAAIEKYYLTQIDDFPEVVDSVTT